MEWHWDRNRKLRIAPLLQSLKCVGWTEETRIHLYGQSSVKLTLWRNSLSTIRGRKLQANYRDKSIYFFDLAHQLR